MHIRFPILLVAINLFSAVAYAAPEPVTVLSYGSDSCGQFVQASPYQRQLYLTYALGYITGANTRDVGNGRFAGKNWERAGMEVWLTNYCTQNGLSLFVSAVENLRTALRGNTPRQ